MQILHSLVHDHETYEGDIKLGGVAILFSIEDYTADLTYEQQETFNHFFENLRWFEDYENPRVAGINFGDIMSLIDFRERWVYKGTMTSPPCQGAVYWNIVKKVYPIDSKYVDLLYRQFARSANPELPRTGNWRIT